MPHRRLSLAVTALLGVSAGAHAQNAVVDFGRIPGLDAQPTVHVVLNRAMLDFVGEVAREQDPQAADVLASIRGVRAYAYENVASTDVVAVQRFIDETSSKLETDGWHRAVFVQSGEDKVRMYVKLGDPTGPTPSRWNGLTVMMTDGSGDAFFVNVDGQVDPSLLGRLTALGGHGMLGGLGGFGNLAPRGQNGDDPE